MENSNEKPFLGNLLLVDDEQGFSFLAKLLLKQLSQELGEVSLVHIPNPSSFLTHIKANGSSRPDLILMDINMPGCDGITLLKQLRAEPFGKIIPVGIMSDQLTNENVETAYDAGANFCFHKPQALDDFKNLFRDLLHFWFEVVVRIA
jgi:CheY-like chemotaxis protein